MASTFSTIGASLKYVFFYSVFVKISSMFLLLALRDGSLSWWTVDCEYGKKILGAVHLLGFQEQSMHVLESFQHHYGLESTLCHTQIRPIGCHSQYLWPSIFMSWLTRTLACVAGARRGKGKGKSGARRQSTPLTRAFACTRFRASRESPSPFPF